MLERKRALWQQASVVEKKYSTRKVGCLDWTKKTAAEE